MQLRKITGLFKFNQVMAQLRAGTYDSNTIDLSSCGITNEQAEALLTALRKYPHQTTEINHINLSHNRLTEAYVVDVENIMSLDFSHNKISKFRAAKLPYLGKLIVNNNLLKVISIAHLKTLQVLNVANNLLQNLDVANLQNLHTLNAEQPTLETILFSKAVLNTNFTFDPKALNPTTKLFIESHAIDYPEAVKAVTVRSAHKRLYQLFAKPNIEKLPADKVFTNDILRQYINKAVTVLLQRDNLFDKAAQVYAYLSAASKASENHIALILREYLNDDIINLTEPVMNEILTVAYKQKNQAIVDSAVDFMSKEYHNIEKAIISKFINRLQKNNKLAEKIAKLEVDRTATQKIPAKAITPGYLKDRNSSLLEEKTITHKPNPYVFRAGLL